ncbi:MAG TPA: TIGR02453 family protein [Sulfurimonas sp. UBA12504]|nr:MAG: TIGR02453 family protein [Sulfurimonas sp. GWF2_37_8]DAB30309.1 MAG TPA: TIGR02453 family protein [Sulfurimonas sp. UBA12504]
MEFQGFSPKTLPFLQAIKENNNKEWFEAHKSEYEQLILNPSRAFVVEMGEHLQALEPSINAEPKINQSLYRIYRDTRRMGANKAPIKHRIGIIFWQGRGKRMQSSAFYLHFSPEELMVAVGVRWFEKPMLDAFREYIKDETKRVELDGVLKSIKAKEKGYTHLEKGYKRYPKGFSAELPSADLSLYKGMATFKVLDPHLIEDGQKLIDTLYEIYEDMLPLQQIMYEVSLRVKED